MALYVALKQDERKAPGCKLHGNPKYKSPLQVKTCSSVAIVEPAEARVYDDG
jgi:hypothetical protein